MNRRRQKNSRPKPEPTAAPNAADPALNPAAPPPEPTANPNAAPSATPAASPPTAAPTTAKETQPSAQRPKAFKTPLLLALAFLAILTAAGALLWHGSSPARALQELPPNTLVEFGDFNCPACAAFAVQTLPRLQQDFLNPGLLSYEYRHYPFLGEGSRQAALAAECAQEQDAFYAFHDAVYLELARAVFGSSPNTPPRPDPNDAERFHQIGAAAVADPERYQACLADPATAAAIAADREMAERLGVPGTPTLFLNGKMLPHSLLSDYPALAAELERTRLLPPPQARRAPETAPPSAR